MGWKVTGEARRGGKVGRWERGGGNEVRNWDVMGGKGKGLKQMECVRRGQWERGRIEGH